MSTHTPDSPSSESPPPRFGIAIPIALSAAIPLLVYFVVMQYYRMPISKATLLLDFFFLAYVAALFSLFQRSKRMAVIPFVMVTSLFLIAVIQKYVMLRVWVRISDFSILDEAWAVLPLAHRLAIPIVAIIAGAIALYNRQRPNLRHLLSLSVPAMIVAVVVVIAPGLIVQGLRNSTNAVFGNTPLYRSVFFALGYDFVDRLAFERSAASLLADQDSRLQPLFPMREPPSKRNIHIFVLESFMDPLQLGIESSQDPMDERIRKSLGGYSAAPVFGGRTAQSEFELLCGTPVYDFLDPITFNDLRGNTIESLPSHLRKHNYVTLASTDVPGNFFNMREAYQSLGFSQTYFRDAFPSQDMDGEWISADEHIAFNKKLIQPLLEREQPFLNYVLFVTGHTPYAMNPDKRPAVLTTESTAEVTRFVNSVYYITKSLADYIDYLVANDPDCLILVVGDHQGALPSISRSSDWMRRFEFERYLTPYLFLDSGQAQAFGDIAHFDAAHMIALCLYGVPFSPPSRKVGVDLIRPFNRQAYYKYQGELHRCPNEQDPRCAAVTAFRQQTIARWIRLIQQSRPSSE